MSPEDNGWAEYKLMILDWHNQDIEEKREIRARLEAHEKAVTTQLTEIQTTLAEIKGVRAARRTFHNIGIPAVVTILVLLAETAIAHFMK